MSVTKTTGSRGVPVSAHEQVQARCALAEECLCRVLNEISPELLVRHNFDWKAATEEVCGE